MTATVTQTATVTVAPAGPQEVSIEPGQFAVFAVGLALLVFLASVVAVLKVRA